MAFMGTENVSPEKWLFLMEAQTTLGLFHRRYRCRHIIPGMIRTRRRVQEALTFQS